MRNKGSETLRFILFREGTGASAKLAEEMGVQRSLLSRWVNGHLKPNAGHRLELAERYDIDWQEWDEDAPSEQPEGDAA